MFLKKAFFVITGVLVLFPLWAGDSASFVDLGFSPDGKTFMFAQYGVQSRTLRPWAELFVVDVASNNFVSGGKVSYTHDNPVLAGQDGTGALYRIIAKNTALADRYRLDYLNQGQPLYIALSGDFSGTGESIEFRDFESGNSYQARLVPNVEGSGQNLKSSFFINLNCDSRSGRRSYTVGNPQIKRPFIGSYCIKKVMIAPHDGSMIFVIEMKRQADGDVDTRYMVEALKL
jgi:predicted secreted protein